MEEESKIFYEDFKSVCRVCLAGQNLQSFPRNAFELYLRLVNLENSDNMELPQNICINCVSHLEDMFIFSEKCRLNEIMLNKIYAERHFESQKNGFFEEKDIKFEDEDVASPSSNEDAKLDMVHNDGEKTRKSYKIKNKSPIECKLCSKIMYGKGAFSNHLRMHKKKREPNKYLCNYCGKNFMKSSHLDRHIRSHTGVKPYQCQMCDKSFAQGNDLKRHQLTHTREKIFQCSMCPKSFHQKSVLDNHLLIHVNERNIQCQFCDKKFAMKAYLDVHMRTHTGLKPFQCPQCYKQFHQKSGLNNHILTHTGEKPFKCSTCDKTFIQSNHLKEHARIHSGEKPYSCSYCDKTFTYSSTLKVHLRQHTGEKPFICNICEKGFHDSSNLRRHVHRHTNKKCKDGKQNENILLHY